MKDMFAKGLTLAEATALFWVGFGGSLVADGAYALGLWARRKLS